MRGRPAKAWTVADRTIAGHASKLAMWRRLWHETPPSASLKRRYYKAMCDTYHARIKALKCP